MMHTRRNELLVRLLDALERYYQHVSAVDDDGRRVFAEITAWFDSTDATDERGFERLCADLGIDAEHVRRSLAQRSGEIRGPRIAPRRR